MVPTATLIMSAGSVWTWDDQDSGSEARRGGAFLPALMHARNRMINVLSWRGRPVGTAVSSLRMARCWEKTGSSW